MTDTFEIRRVTIADCVDAVSRRFNVPRTTLLGPDRRREITKPRQVAMWLARELTPKSLPMLGRVLGRDHTTILHGIRRVEAMRAVDRDLRVMTDLCREDIAHREDREPYDPRQMEMRV